jgi:hypothetical protein
MYVGWGMLLWIYSFRALRSYRRFGHLPRRLYLDSTAHQLGERREGKVRWRQWPLTAIKYARLSTIHNLLRRPAGGVLQIRLRKWPFFLAVRCGVKDLPSLRGFAMELAGRLPERVSLSVEE